MIYNLQTKEWKLFAEGLLLPLGILAVSNSEVLVMQLTNLMRIKDTMEMVMPICMKMRRVILAFRVIIMNLIMGPVKDKAATCFLH
jgi:hypothetical protein